MKKTALALLIVLIMATVPAYGCLISRANLKYQQKEVCSFVLEHRDELDAVVEEICDRYDDELKEKEIFIINNGELKPCCPATETFFATYVDDGYDQITVLDHECFELMKRSATGNMWTYVGCYFSMNGAPHRFFDGELKETGAGRWVETVEGSDNSSES